MHLENEKKGMPFLRYTFCRVFENFYQVDSKRQLFLDTEKLLSWMEGVIQKTFNEFDTDGSWYILGKNRVRLK